MEGTVMAGDGEGMAGAGAGAGAWAWGGTTQKCASCGRIVYPVEELAADGRAYNRPCFPLQEHPPDFDFPISSEKKARIQVLEAIFTCLEWVVLHTALMAILLHKVTQALSLLLLSARNNALIMTCEIKGNGATGLVISLLGAMVMPHNLFLHSALVLSRKVPRSVHAIKEACRFYIVESAFALTVAFLINISIISVSGAVCGSDNLNPEDQMNCKDLDLNKASWFPYYCIS